MATAFLAQPYDSDFARIRTHLQDALEANGVAMVRAVDLPSTEPLIEGVYAALAAADVVVADVSTHNPNVLYGRPVVTISGDMGFVPFDVRSVSYLRYEVDDFDPEPIVRAVLRAIAHPEEFARRPHTRREINSVFLSYSHRDQAIHDRLLVHLRPLEREGLIDAWSDRRILAGSEWKAEIERALSRARAAILLISADFLASDFIIDDELPPLLRGAKERGTLIVPLIVKPCRFVRDGHLSAFQAINDPARPLLALADVEQEQLLDDVGALVERAMRPARD